MKAKSVTEGDDDFHVVSSHKVFLTEDNLAKRNVMGI
jgi:hypothetical protein